MAIKKVIHFSDLHAGHREITEDDFNELFSAIVQYADSETLIVFTGDLFHKRVPVDSDANKLVLALFHLIDSLGIDAIFLNGTRSHECGYMNAFVDEGKYTADVFPTIRFVEKLTALRIDDLDILCLPEEYVDDQKEYYTNVYDDSRYHMTLFHGTISDIAVYNNSIESVQFKKAPTFKKKELWGTSKIVLCGHIHENQTYTSDDDDYLSYVGSWGKMEHSTNEKNRIGCLHVYTIGENSRGEKIVTDVVKVSNHSTSMFITLEGVYLDNNSILLNEEGNEYTVDLSKPDGIELLVQTCRKYTTKGIKIRIKILNGVDVSTRSILTTITSDDPMLLLTLTSDPVRKEETRAQNEVIEIINEFKSMSSMEEQIQHFIKGRLNAEIPLDSIRSVINMDLTN